MAAPCNTPTLQQNNRLLLLRTTTHTRRVRHERNHLCRNGVGNAIACTHERTHPLDGQQHRRQHRFDHRQDGRSSNAAGPNTYSGGTTGTRGTLNINNATAIGTGALVIGGTFTIDNTTASAITLTNNNALTLSGGSLTFTGTKDLSFGLGRADDQRRESHHHHDGGHVDRRCRK